MKPLPTDLEILNAIYERYYNEFALGTRANKAVHPDDVKAVARDLNVDADIVFGRLYYHLEPKYRRPREKFEGDTSNVTVFLAKTDYGFHGVHFPYLASVLASCVLMIESIRRRRT